MVSPVNRVRVSRSRQLGALMIELLVTLAVVVIGLWGVLDLHTRLQFSEREAYQRTQALLLLDDMVQRIKINRHAAVSYVTDPVLGSGESECADLSSLPAGAKRDIAQWCGALRGTAAAVAGAPAGGLIAGRGCVEALHEVPGEEYLLTVVWQGAVPLSAPPEDVRCGKGHYNLPVGSACARNADSCRRYISTRIHIAGLVES